MDLNQTMSSQTQISNIVIYGNSTKFIAIIQALFPKASTTILPWRTPKQEAAIILAKSTMPADLLVLCGYDYSSYSVPENLYLERNVYQILAVCKLVADNSTKIIYIDTLSTNKGWTYSRYLYAKNILGHKLKIALAQTQIFRIPTVFDQQNEIGMQGGMISQIAAKVLIYLGIIQAINFEQLQDHIKGAIQNGDNILDPSPVIRPILINIPRPQLIDRALRILLG
jgi:hypothetical protein